HPRREEGVDTKDRKRSSHAGLPPRQDDARRPGGDAAAVPQRGASAARGARAAHAGSAAGRVAAARRSVGGGAGAGAGGGAGGGGGARRARRRRPWGVAVEPRAWGDGELAYGLRPGSPAVMGRLREGRLVLDVRTVFAEQEETLVEAVQYALQPAGP